MKITAKALTKFKRLIEQHEYAKARTLALEMQDDNLFQMAKLLFELHEEGIEGLVLHTTIKLIIEQRKLNAVKHFKDYTGYSLKEAVDMVNMLDTAIIFLEKSGAIFEEKAGFE